MQNLFSPFLQQYFCGLCIYVPLYTDLILSLKMCSNDNVVDGGKKNAVDYYQIIEKVIIKLNTMILILL